MRFCLAQDPAAEISGLIAICIGLRVNLGNYAIPLIVNYAIGGLIYYYHRVYYN